MELLNAYFRLFYRYPAAVIQCLHGLPPSAVFSIIPDSSPPRNREVAVIVNPPKHGE